MPEAFTIGLGEFLSNGLKAYFKKFGRLPPKDLAIKTVTTLTGAESFETLLKAVKKSKETSFLVYAHGQSDGSGLFLRLALRRGAPTGVSTTANMLDLLMRLDGRDKPASDRELGTLGINKVEAENLIGLRRDIRAKKIDTLEFRGCNLGRNLNSVQKFKEFFGAKTFGAPDLYSFFGVSPIQIGQKYIAEHRKHRPGGDWHEYSYTFENPSGTLVNNVATDANLKPAQGYIVADSLETVQRWVKQYIDSNGTYATKEGSLPLHGLWDTGKRKIDPKAIQDAPLGSDQALPGPAIIMPLGSNDYKDHVIYG